MKKWKIYGLALGTAFVLAACSQPAQNEQPETSEMIVEKPSEASAESTENPEAESTEPAETEVPEEVESIRVYGTVTEMFETAVMLENDNIQDPYQQIKVNVTEETLILDAVTGEKREFENLKSGDVLYAYVSPAMTRSLPPMSNAEVIFCGIPADFPAPEYARITEVSLGEEEGTASLTTNRDIIYHVSPETEIYSLSEGESVSLEDLTEDTMVVAWYQIVMESFPAQASSEKIMIVR